MFVVETPHPVSVLTTAHWTEALLHPLQARRCHKHPYLWSTPGWLWPEEYLKEKKARFYSAHADPSQLNVFSWTDKCEINQNTLLNSTTQSKPNETFFFCLTPSNSAKLEYVGGNVDVEDLDQSVVHVHCLQTHPGERGQQEVVQRGSSGDAEAVVGEGREPGVDEEEHVQPQQGSRQVDEYLGRVVLTQLPEEFKREKDKCRE